MGFSMALNRDALLNRKKLPLQVCKLASGDEVLMRVPGTPDWRAYQASLRNKDGEFIEKRMDRGDELLIATLLIDSSTKELMFTSDDVMGGIFDSDATPAADVNAMAAKAYELYGRNGSPKLVTDEDREKNSLETVPSE